MGLVIVALRKVTTLTQFVLIEAAQFEGLQRLFQYIAANQPPHQLQNFLHLPRYLSMVCRHCLSARQQEIFAGRDAGDVFPEYYVLRVNDFDKVARTPLDEWISFLKTGEIDRSATAKGLPEARERLRVDALPDAEKRAYLRDMEALRYQRSVIKTGWDEGRVEGLKEGREEGLKEGAEQERTRVAREMKGMGMPVDVIARCTGLSAEDIGRL